MKRLSKLVLMVWLAIALLQQVAAFGAQIYLGQGVLAGEVTENSVILQARLTAAESVLDDNVPGIRGVVRFEIDTVSTFPRPRQTEWLPARPDGDFTVKAKMDGLEPGTLYYFRAWIGSHERQATPDLARSFRTLGGAKSQQPVKFVVASGMNYAAFHAGTSDAVEKDNGYPALVSIYRLEPDFFVGNGNNVYYDFPPASTARTLPEMRHKWHEQFVQVRMTQLLSLMPAYWLKNNRDCADAELGPKVFCEQVPVTDPKDPTAVTYRTHRLNRHVQVWFVESRDQRSVNESPDGSEKSLWGATQKAWLKRTLKESDATFKLLISPTPMVGGFEDSSRDSHASPGGFQHEGREFFEWLAANRIGTNEFFILCGGVNWQYRARHPLGYEEFSSGPLNVEQATAPRKADTSSIPPLYVPPKPTGGFLLVDQTLLNGTPQLMITFKDESGTSLHFSRTLGRMVAR